MLHAEERAPEIDGVDRVELVNVGLEQVLRVPVEPDGGIVHLRRYRSIRDQSSVSEALAHPNPGAGPLHFAHGILT